MGLPLHAERVSGVDRASSSRFSLLLKIASGGMGTVYLGHQRGAAGFQRLVAIKKAHPHLIEDENVLRMLVMEARLASLVRHPNVVGVTDVEDANGELLLVMEYVEGASLSELIAASTRIPLGIAMRIILDSCEGLDAMHRAEDEEGAPLALVHRDVSPQNVLVGVDGVARVADFGIARATATDEMTGVLRGKPAYMSPEYAATAQATPSNDVFALAVVAWETFTQRRLFKGFNDIDAAERVRSGRVPRPSSVQAGIPRSIDDVILKALSVSPEDRYPSARAFANALVATTRSSSDWDDGADTDPDTRIPWIASRADVGAYVATTFEAKLLARREMLRRETPVEPWGQMCVVPSAVGDETPRPTTTDGGPRQIVRPTPPAFSPFPLEPLPPPQAQPLVAPTRLPVLAACIAGVVCMLGIVATTVGLSSRGRAAAAQPATELMSPSSPVSRSSPRSSDMAGDVPSAPTQGAEATRVASPRPAIPPHGVVTATPPPVVTAAPVVTASAAKSPPATPPAAVPASTTAPLLLAPPATAPENPY